MMRRQIGLDGNPEKPGDYMCWYKGANYPVVLHWNGSKWLCPNLINSELTFGVAADEWEKQRDYYDQYGSVTL